MQWCRATLVAGKVPDSAPLTVSVRAKRKYREVLAWDRVLEKYEEI